MGNVRFTEIPYSYLSRPIGKTLDVVRTEFGCQWNKYNMKLKIVKLINYNMKLKIETLAVIIVNTDNSLKFQTMSQYRYLSYR
ncbi:hypothetical protein OUZ56_010367 [Daphnia magna]|uniref:Uncharacterized protein n=1 Tax=Daphnia magna TaxID=35525 RepID=A0ABR0AIC4_9CRUS|nr:hypothetical protein OUZ56_010367 [Daphnia magna]